MSSEARLLLKEGNMPMKMLLMIALLAMPSALAAAEPAAPTPAKCCAAAECTCCKGMGGHKMDHGAGAEAKEAADPHAGHKMPDPKGANGATPR